MAGHTHSPAHSPADGAVLCFCNSNAAWGGGEHWHLETALRLAARGHRVILACGRDSALHQAARRELEGNPALSASFSLADWHFGRLSFLNPFKTNAFAGFLQRNNVSHLIMGLPSDLKAGVLAAAGRRIQLFYRRGSALPIRPTRFNRFLYGSLDALIVNSEETARCALESGQLIKPDRVRLIYNGLDAAAFDAAMGEMRPFAAHATGRPLVIGNAGRLNRQKGQKYLLHMSAALKRARFPHQLVIAGAGELEKELCALARTLGLRIGRTLPQARDSKPDGAPEVCFTGFMYDMAPFWRAIDLFALSSLWEGFGYVLAEAMLARKPLLAFNCNSMPEMVKPGLNGELISPPGPDEADEQAGARLAAAIQEMAGDPSAMARMGEAGRAFCLEHFDQESALRKLEAALGIASPL